MFSMTAHRLREATGNFRTEKFSNTSPDPGNEAGTSCSVIALVTRPMSRSLTYW